MVSMEAPDADPELGPAIMMMGAAQEQDVTAQVLYERFVSDLETGIEASEPQEITVGGVAGLVADVSGAMEGQELTGRLVFVLATPTQSFVAFAAAPPERWGGELEPLFEAVLASVSFFEPVTELDLPAEGEDTGSGAAGAGEELRQWATSATASSEYGNPDQAATQATGAPDTFACEDLSTAWAADDHVTVEWLELGYDVPVYPSEINIIQTYSPDQVVKVELIDVAGTYHQVYSAEPNDRWDECPYTLSIAVETDYQVTGIKITIDQSVLGIGHNEIDAVELVGYTG